MAQQHHHDSLSQHTSQYSDSYHVYHLRYRLIRMAQMLLACALLHVTQLNMQREVRFQRTRCLSDVLQHAAARARWPAATGHPRHTPVRGTRCTRWSVMQAL